MNPREEFQKNFDVSRETLDRLSDYEALLKKWTVKINLVSKSTLDDIWNRHFIDSAQVFRALPVHCKKVADFGSGGGFPGLVVAILNAELSPDVQTILIESDQRKSMFLSTVVRELGLDAKVLAERVELAAPQAAHVATARALAPLEDLLPLAKRHLHNGGQCLFLKGERHQEEVEVARRTWDFDLEIQESLTHSRAALLRITNLKAKQ